MREDPRDFGLSSADLHLAADRLYQAGDDRLDAEAGTPDEAVHYGTIRTRLRSLADAIGRPEVTETDLLTAVVEQQDAMLTRLDQVINLLKEK